jgi:hypothetical protein
VAGKEIAVKKYVVRLDAEERDRLDELIRKGKRSAQLLTKARILLKATRAGAADRAVAYRLPARLPGWRQTPRWSRAESPIAACDAV